MLLQKGRTHMQRDIHSWIRMFKFTQSKVLEFRNCYLFSVGVVTILSFVWDDLFCPYNACIPYENHRLLTESARGD